MVFRQESDTYEIWYSLTDDPNEELSMFTMSKYMTIRELSWWLRNIHDQYSVDAKIHIIREHFE